MHWFKMYAEFAKDPKVQSMPEAMQRRLVMLLCLHCDADLDYLDDEQLGVVLRITKAELEKTRRLFLKMGFIGEGGWEPRNWVKRQAGPDPEAANRMRRLRERRRLMAEQTEINS